MNCAKFYMASRSTVTLQSRGIAFDHKTWARSRLDFIGVLR